jgi:hypothetical protein
VAQYFEQEVRKGDGKSGTDSTVSAGVPFAMVVSEMAPVVITTAPPTTAPTGAPTSAPTAPTDAPTTAPTGAPSIAPNPPTPVPTPAQSIPPTDTPTGAPTNGSTPDGSGSSGGASDGSSSSSSSSNGTSSTTSSTVDPSAQPLVGGSTRGGDETKTKHTALEDLVWWAYFLMSIGLIAVLGLGCVAYRQKQARQRRSKGEKDTSCINCCGVRVSIGGKEEGKEGAQKGPSKHVLERDGARSTRNQGRNGMNDVEGGTAAAPARPRHLSTETEAWEEEEEEEGRPKRRSRVRSVVSRAWSKGRMGKVGEEEGMEGGMGGTEMSPAALSPTPRSMQEADADAFSAAALSLAEGERALEMSMAAANEIVRTKATLLETKAEINRLQMQLAAKAAGGTGGDGGELGPAVSSPMSGLLWHPSLTPSPVYSPARPPALPSPPKYPTSVSRLSAAAAGGVAGAGAAGAAGGGALATSGSPWEQGHIEEVQRQQRQHQRREKERALQGRQWIGHQPRLQELHRVQGEQLQRVREEKLQRARGETAWRHSRLASDSSSAVSPAAAYSSHADYSSPLQPPPYPLQHAPTGPVHISSSPFSPASPSPMASLPPPPLYGGSRHSPPSAYSQADRSRHSPPPAMSPRAAVHQSPQRQALQMPQLQPLQHAALQGHLQNLSPHQGGGQGGSGAGNRRMLL